MKLTFFKADQPDSTNKRILRAALTVGLLSLLARGGIALRELVIAKSFGRGDAIDAFLIAFALPTFVVNLLMGALASSLIPVLIQTRKTQGAAAGQKLLSSMMFLSVITLSAVALLLGLLAPYYLPYLGSSFSAAKLQLTRDVLLMLLPWVIFSGCGLFVSAALNAGEKFAVPSLAPLITPLATIVFIVLTAPRWGVVSLVAGTVSGSILEAAVLIRALKSKEAQWTLRWGGMDANVRGVLLQCAPMLAGAFLMGSTSLVDQSMAAMLAGGSVAALSYGSKIVGAISTTGANALSTAALPYFSKMISANDWNGCRHTLKRYSLLAASVTLPLTLLLMVFSRPLVRLVFQRGAFTAADTELVTWIQICYAIQIPFYVLSLLFVRFLSSARRNDLLMYASAINLFVDIVLNLFFMRFWGVAGIALSTSIVFLISFAFVSICSIRILSRKRMGTDGSLESAAPING